MDTLFPPLALAIIHRQQVTTELVTEYKILVGREKQKINKYKILKTTQCNVLIHGIN